MLKKTLSIFTLATFLFSVTFNDLALAQSQDQEFKKPTFEEIYKNYSFLDTANLAEIVQSKEKEKYTEDELKKEFEELKKKEMTERQQVRVEQKNALAELKKNQNILKKNSNEIEKLRTKYTSTVVIIENNKPRKDKRVDENALANDPQYQILLEARKIFECQVREWQIKSNDTVFRTKLNRIETYYEVLQTQLDLLQKWPIALKKIETDSQSGKAAERKFAHPENIGLRDLGVGNQEDDRKIWQDPEAKRFLEDLRKKEYKDQAVKNYVMGLIKLIASNSDLTIPIDEKNIFITDEDDVNASAFPGGVFLINRGLLAYADNEAQIAGVFAHEIGHAAARHGYHRYKKFQIIDIFKTVGKVILALSGIGYWVYYGLSILLDTAEGLAFLGITRESEIEADILGMQYLEKAGYAPMSFMDFFEKMGRDKGYVRRTSWFRSHPAFAERIINTLKEYRFLTLKDEYIINSNDFFEMQARLCVAQEIEKADAAKRAEKQKKPSLTRGQQKKQEELDEKCGLQRIPLEQKNSPCDKIELRDFKEKVRAEVMAEREKQDKVEEEKPRLKRP